MYLVEPDGLFNRQFPDRSSVKANKKRSDKIEIDLNDLLAQGVQRRQEKEAKKQEWRGCCKWIKEGIAGPKDCLQNEGNSQIDEEARNIE